MGRAQILLRSYGKDCTSVCACFTVNCAKHVFSGSCFVQAPTVSGNFLVLREMAQASPMARVDSERERFGMESFVSPSADLSYTSALAVERIANLEGLARARHEKPKRWRDEGRYLLENWLRRRPRVKRGQLKISRKVGRRARAGAGLHVGAPADPVQARGRRGNDHAVRAGRI